MTRADLHPSLVDHPSELTPDWLTAALRREGSDAVVTDVRVDHLGWSDRQQCLRLHLRYATPGSKPPTIIAKLAPTDPRIRSRVAAATSAELTFHAELARTVAVRTPRCLLASGPDESGRFVLLLEDLVVPRFGDELTGCCPDQARGALSNLAALHGPRWCDPTLGRLGWLDSRGPDASDRFTALYRAAAGAFRDRFVDELELDDRRLLRRIGSVIGRWSVGRPDRWSILHGDYRLGRLAFPPFGTDVDGAADVTVVDWRMATIGLPGRDVAFFLSTALPREDRRRSERALVEHYHAALARHGVTDLSIEDCWDDYRYGMLQGPLVTLLCATLSPRSEVGDEISMLMVTRSLDAVRDLGTLDLI